MDADVTFALRARWIFPVATPPIRDGVITIDGDRIVAVGENRSGERPIDLGNAAVLPAPANAHTHLEFSDLTEPLGEPGVRLPDWIRLVVAHRRRQMDAGDELSAIRRAAIQRGVEESLRCGVGAVGEIATAPWFADVFDEGDLYTTAFLELLGLKAEREEYLLAAAKQHLSTSIDESSGKMLRRGLSPHAPYTVNPELLRRAVELSATYRAPLAMHLAESVEELELLQSGSGPLADVLRELDAWDAAALPRGLRPMDYLQTLAAAERALVIHGNFLAGDEIGFMAEHADRMSLVYCPRTHAYFQHGRYPLAEMIEAGANVALGTDSRASNPDLNLFREMQWVANHHSDVAPEAVLQMGTINGARALGIDDQMGTIEVGRPAILACIDGGDFHASDPYEWLFSAQEDRRISGAIRNGRTVRYIEA